MVSVRCAYTFPDGSKCRRTTKDGSGYCTSHAGIMEEYLGDVTLHCNVCIAKDTCPKYKVNKNGLCWFETADPTLDLKTREDVRLNMAKAIANEIKLLRRMNRLVNQEGDADSIKNFILLSKQVVEHCERYGVFQGYHEGKVKKRDEDKTRLYILQQIFGEPSQRVHSDILVKPEVRKMFSDGKEVLKPTITVEKESEEENA